MLGPGGFACPRGVSPPERPGPQGRQAGDQRRALWHSRRVVPALSRIELATLPGAFQAGDGSQGGVQASPKELMADLASVYAPVERSECLCRGQEVAAKWRSRSAALAAMLEAGLEDTLSVLGLPEPSPPAVEHEPAGEHHEAAKEANAGGGDLSESRFMRPADRLAVAGAA